MVKDENITKFQLKYWTYLTKNHPRLLMNKPGDRGPRSTWIIFKGRGFPKNVEFNHKFNQQRLELGFNQTEKEKLLAARTDWPDDIIIDQRGAQATISLGTPKIDIRDDFDQQIPAIEEVFKAAERLAQYASILVQPPASLNDDGHSPATKRLDTLDERSTPKKDENINSGTKKQFRHERFVGEWTDQQVLTPVTPIDERQSHRDSNYGINPGSLEDRAVGCLLGLAVGDALGAPVEFKSPGSFEPITGLRAGGPFNLKAGEWTDDTSMALSLADTLLEDPELKDFSKLLQRWVNWYKQGAYSHTGTCFDIGNQTRNALEAFVRGKTPTLTDSAGNGGIMRLAPVAVRHHNHPNLAASIARKQSELTHNNQVCTDNAAQLANILVSLISHTEKDSHLFLPPLLDHKLIKSTGYVVDTLNAAGWAFMTTNSFEKATLKAVNLGGDSDTIGAVTGQIAGAAYGLSAIPRDWLNQLAWRDQIIEIARKLFMAETATA